MIERFLLKNYEFKRNEVLGRVEYRKKKNSQFKIMEDVDFNSIIRKIEKKGIRVTPQKLNIKLNSDFVKNYNPVKNYFKNLPLYKGDYDYIDELAKTISCNDNEYFRWVFKKWLVATVGCGINERVVNHTVLIFCGKQNLGKTTWFRNLLPEALREYFYAGSINPGDKDSKILISQNLIVNMDELANFNKSKNEQFKEMITTEEVTLRKPYAVHVVKYIRRASFVGSSNHTEILTDITGNRRYLCVEVDKINYNHDIDLEKVYSQALYLLNDKNFRYYFNDEDVLRVDEQNEYFTQKDEEQNWIEELFKIPNGKEKTVSKNATEVAEYIKKSKRIYKNISSVKIGQILSTLGFQKRGKLKKYELIIK